MNPLISVLVAAYNVEKYLPNFFNCLINQTYTNLEIIIVDDGSIDLTGKICDTYAQENPNIHVIHTVNNGVSMARNICLKYAKGDYISFVDPDDEFSFNLYAKAVQFINKTNCDLIILNRYNIYSNKDKVEFKNFKQTGILDKHKVLQKLFDDKLGSQLWEKIYKKELWNDVRFTPGRVYAEDVAVLHKIFDKAKRIGALAEPLYYYHINDSTLTTSYRPFKWMSTYLAFKERLDFVERKYPHMSNKLKASTLNFARLTLDNYLQRHEECDEPYIPEITDRLKSCQRELFQYDLKWYNKLIIYYYLLSPSLYSHTIKYIHYIFYSFKPNKFR